MRVMLRRFAANADGATAIEYGLIVTVIVIAILGALSAVASGTTSKYNTISSAIQNSM